MKAKKINAAVKSFIKPTHTALAAHGEGEKHLKVLGEKVAAQFTTREAFAAVKSDFVAACILTAPRYAEQARIIAAPLGKKDSPDGNAIREAKAKARSTVGMAWGLIAKYAFPAVESTGETRGRKKKAEHVKLREHLEAALKIARDSESPMFDAVDMAGAIKIAIAMLPNGIAPSKAESGKRDVKAPKAPRKAKAPRANKSTIPGTVSLGAPKQKTRNARKAKPTTKMTTREARDLMGAISA